jgi:hypothetical protein
MYMKITEQGRQRVRQVEFVAEIPGYRGMSNLSPAKWKNFLTMRTALALAGEDYNTIMFASVPRSKRKHGLNIEIPGVRVGNALSDYGRRFEFLKFLSLNLKEIAGFVGEQTPLLEVLRAMSKAQLN